MFRKKKSHSATIAIGSLNVAYLVVVLERAFLRRLIYLTRGITKSYYRIRLFKAARLDLKAWQFVIQR